MAPREKKNDAKTNDSSTTSRTGYHPSYSPQHNTGKGYAPRSSYLPTRVASSDPKKNGLKRLSLIVGIVAMVLISFFAMHEKKIDRKLFTYLEKTLLR